MGRELPLPGARIAGAAVRFFQQCIEHLRSARAHSGWSGCNISGKIHTNLVFIGLLNWQRMGAFIY